MPELNEQGKPWWKSKTIWGLALTTIGVIAPKYQPVAQLLPPLVDQIATTVGLILGFYGRITAKEQLK